MISSIATVLPPWDAGDGARACGPDEDAVTLAVAAGRAALAADGTDVALVVGVELVTRDLPLLEGGNAAALLGGLGVARTVDVVERVGGAPAALDAVSSAADGMLVIAVDAAHPAGAAAALTGARGAMLEPQGRVHRSLPLRTRWADGKVFADDDPRLERERGLRASLEATDLPGKPLVLAGASMRDAAAFAEGPVVPLPTLGASAAIFALAALADRATSGLVAAVEQATLSAAQWDPGDVRVGRDEPAPRATPVRRTSPGPDIKIAFTAYERAFEPKLRWEAGGCRSCGELAFPLRHRCLVCGTEGDTELVALPRTGTVYTATTIHTPVPAMSTPYSLAVVELDGVGVRALVGVTDGGTESLEIGTRGRLVFRRVAVRSGVPDYGYAFSPDVDAVDPVGAP